MCFSRYNLYFTVQYLELSQLFGPTTFASTISFTISAPKYLLHLFIHYFCENCIIVLSYQVPMSQYATLYIGEENQTCFVKTPRRKKQVFIELRRTYIVAFLFEYTVYHFLMRRYPCIFKIEPYHVAILHEEHYLSANCTSHNSQCV